MYQKQNEEICAIEKKVENLRLERYKDVKKDNRMNRELENLIKRWKIWRERITTTAMKSRNQIQK